MHNVVVLLCRYLIITQTLLNLYLYVLCVWTLTSCRHTPLNWLKMTSRLLWGHLCEDRDISQGYQESSNVDCQHRFLKSMSSIRRVSWGLRKCCERWERERMRKPPEKLKMRGKKVLFFFTTVCLIKQMKLTLMLSSHVTSQFFGKLTKLRCSLCSFTYMEICVIDFTQIDTSSMGMRCCLARYSSDNAFQVRETCNEFF